MDAAYGIDTAVVISGSIRTGTYLSRADGSEKEYFNTSYDLYLDKPIDITDENRTTTIYRGITHVEIRDPFSHDTILHAHGRLTIKGILRALRDQPGYHRQYSTPVCIEVLEIMK